MLTATRIVFVFLAVFGALKTTMDKTGRDSMVSVAMICVAVVALLESFGMV